MPTHERWIEYDIAERLRQRRIDIGLSQIQVAERVGVNVVGVHCWEVGKAWPVTFERLGRWCNSLGVVAELRLRMRNGRELCKIEL